MGLIEDEDFETIAGRSKNGSFAKIAGVVYAVVAGCVDFDYVE
jgi:hypothetical protein